MKRKLILVCSLFISLLTFAQETEFRYDNGNYGLYNVRTSRWVSPRIYDNYNNLGSYSGIYYYAVKKNNLWGIMNERGEIVVANQFEEVGEFQNGFYTVKLDGSWGLADVYNHLIIACKYKRLSLWSDICYASPWNDNNQDLFQMDQLVIVRNRANQADKESLAREIRAKQEKIAREKKEKELASFTEYARSFVEPKINHWQRKGEFEKLADYQKRVTGPNRTAMIDSLTRAAEENFIAEHTALKPENEYMKLDLYDSENEVFFIESLKLGKIVLPIPISEGPDFKAHFHSLEKKNATYYIIDDKIALASLDFYNKETDKIYHFTNDKALNYNHYEIDPDIYQFDLVNIITAKPVENPATNAVTASKRPVITILIPEKKSTYTEPMVTIRYHASVFDGSKPTLHVWVNGLETNVFPKPKDNSKSIDSDWDEVELALPKEKEKPCNIIFSVTDDSGYSSENKSILLQYVD